MIDFDCKPKLRNVPPNDLVHTGKSRFKYLKRYLADWYWPIVAFFHTTKTSVRYIEQSVKKDETHESELKDWLLKPKDETNCCADDIIAKLLSIDYKLRCSPSTLDDFDYLLNVDWSFSGMQSTHLKLMLFLKIYTSRNFQSREGYPYTQCRRKKLKELYTTF